MITAVYLTTAGYTGMMTYYQMILRYRYIHNMSFARIGEEMVVDRTTAIRWHDAAISRVVLPANPITI